MCLSLRYVFQAYHKLSDHVVEIQVLQKVADDSKLCDLLNKMHDADKSKTQTSMLQPAFDTLNSPPNLFFLTSKVQSRVSRLQDYSGRGAAPNQCFYTCRKRRSPRRC